MLLHNTLQEYYKIIFMLAQHHKYSIAEIESMIPYERDLYFGMLVDYIEQQNEK